MILQSDVSGTVFTVRLGLLVTQDSRNLHAMLGDNAVVQDGDFRLIDDFAILEFGHLENDVVSLPFTWWTGGVHTGRAKTIQ